MTAKAIRNSKQGVFISQRRSQACLAAGVRKLKNTATSTKGERS